MEPTGVEVTDISQMDNVIYIEPMEARTGTQAIILLKMKNTAEIHSFQFDLYLPEGVTPVKSSNGRIRGSLSAGRLPEEDAYTLTFSEHEGGVVRFLCDSEYGDTFTGNEGEIATLLVNIANYYVADDIETTVTIGGAGTPILGDVNDDGSVTPADAIEALNLYFGAGNNNNARAARPAAEEERDPE